MSTADKPEPPPLGPTLESARLRLDPATLDDAACLHALWTDVDVRRFLWDGVSIARAETESVVARSRELFRTRGFGLWLARERSDLRDRSARPDQIGSASSLVGFAGFWFFRDPPELELLYGLARSRWGVGFAVEMAHAVLRHGFHQLRFDGVRASTDFDNQASIRVMERLGMRFDGRLLVEGRDTVFHRLARRDFVDAETAGSALADQRAHPAPRRALARRPIAD